MDGHSVQKPTKLSVPNLCFENEFLEYVKVTLGIRTCDLDEHICKHSCLVKDKPNAAGLIRKKL
jgi:hypothetical protein